VSSFKTRNIQTALCLDQNNCQRERKIGFKPRNLLCHVHWLPQCCP
jgi:hypothetical protein